MNPAPTIFPQVTLDDCWSLDLNKRDAWTCIWPGQMHCQVWKGVDSDNESYVSSDQGGAAGDESSDDGAALASSFAPIAEGGAPTDDAEESEEARKKAKKAAKKAREKERRRDARQEIAALKETLGVDDGRRTPRAGESVADFYARTAEYWNAEAIGEPSERQAEGAASAKEMRREGFGKARARYEELAPVLRRLDELEGIEAEAEERKAAKKKGDKKQPKKERRR